MQACSSDPSAPAAAAGRPAGRPAHVQRSPAACRLIRCNYCAARATDKMFHRALPELYTTPSHKKKIAVRNVLVKLSQL
jgi:hypothetical protein